MLCVVVISPPHPLPYARIRVISASSPAIRVLAAGCRLQNIHVSSLARASSGGDSVSVGAASAIVSHCTMCSAAGAEGGGCMSFIDCEFENSCQNCIILSSSAAAVVADCVLNCSLGYAAVASDSSLTFIRCSLVGVANVSCCEFFPRCVRRLLCG